MISLTDQLHVAVLDAVVDHFYEVTGAVLAHPVTACCTAIGFRTDVLEQIFNQWPGLRVTAGHDRRSVARAFLATGYTGANEKIALFF